MARGSRQSVRVLPSHSEIDSGFQPPKVLVQGSLVLWLGIPSVYHQGGCQRDLGPFLVSIDLEIGMTSVWIHFLLVFSYLRWARLGEAKVDTWPGPEASPAVPPG